MPADRILFVEDSKNIVELVRYNLQQAGYRVVTARTGDEGLKKALKDRPDVVILDLMLPGMDGLEVCKALRQNEKTAETPIIMLTAKSQETDRVLGLELGADDYITKPFSPRELVARVKAVLRRSGRKEFRKNRKIGSLEIDTDRHIVTVGGKKTDLTHKEFRLLKTLIETNGRVLTREYLLNQVWGYDQSIEIETRTVDMHIGQLRKKLGGEAKRIITVKGEGYRFENEVKI